MALLAAFGDTGPRAQALLAGSIARARPDLALFLGDAVDEHGALKRHRRLSRWQRDMAPLRDNLVAIAGNHDFGRDGSLNAYVETLRKVGFLALREGRFSRDLGGIQLIGLTVPRGAHAVTLDDLTWCDREFERMGPTGVRAIAIHEPLFPVAGRIGLSLDVNQESRDALLRHLGALGVSVVLTGHEHLYARRDIGLGVIQIVTGGGGALDESAIYAHCDASYLGPHFVTLEASEGDLSIKAISASGDVVDRFSMAIAT